MTAYVTTAEFREYMDQVGVYNEQTVTVTGLPTGGTFTLLYEAGASSVIAFNATATAVQAIVRALSGAGASTATVTGPAGGPWNIVGKDLVGPFTRGTNSLTGGTAPDAVVSNTNDSKITNVIARAQNMVDEVLDLPVNTGSVIGTFAGYTSATVETVEAFGGPIMGLPPHQQGSVTVVTYRGGTVPLTGWREEADGSLSRIGTNPYRYIDYEKRFGKNYDNIKALVYWDPAVYDVTANWGLGTVPDSVKEVCLELAVNLWRGRQRGMYTDVVGVEGKGGLLFTGGLTKAQLETLAAVHNRLLAQVDIAI